MYNINLNKIIKILVIVIILTIVLLSRGCNGTVEIQLIGNEKITIPQNGQYIDLGYNIVGTDNTDDFYVDVSGSVNTNKVGVYPIEYILYNKNGKYISKVKRQVTVTNDKLSNISMYLKGEEEEYFFINDYIDHGIEVYNGSTDISDEVDVISNVDIENIGKYEVRYQIYNNSDFKEMIRKINIIDFDIVKEINEVDLVINLNIDCEDYYYTILPDNTKVYSKYVNYSYDEIGEYEFDIYLRSGSHKKYTVYIDSVDNIGPSGTCTIYYDNSKTTITVNAQDPSGISKYSYNGLDFYGNTTMINSIATNVVIRAYDKRYNYTEIKCKAEYTNSFRNVSTSKNGWVKCKTNFIKENNELEMLMQGYGYKTRGAVSAAAVYLLEYKYDIPYFWGGKYILKGFNPSWGCEQTHKTGSYCSRPTNSDHSLCEWGLDCTGYTTWAFIQAGFDRSVVRLDNQSEGKWGNFSAKQHKYAFSNNNISFANQIKPGDIVWSSTDTGGHVGLVIGVDNDSVQIANMVGPIRTTVIKKTGGRVSGNWNFTHFVLMDEFYMMYGN